MKNFVRLNRTFKGVSTYFSRSLMHIALALMLLTLGVGQMWGMTFSGGYVYFDNTNTNWSDGVIEVVAHQYTDHDYIGCTTMSKISGTNNLYYAANPTGSGWSGIWGWRFMSNASAWGSQDCTDSNLQTYATNYTASDNSDIISGYSYLCYGASSSKGCALTQKQLGNSATQYTSLNYTQTLNQTVSTNGGSTYSSSTASIATLTVSSKTLNGRSSTTNSSGTISAGNSSTTCSAARTATVTYTVSSVADGYTFVGWYDGSTQKSTSTTYTYSANAAKTITARFNAETTHDVTITYKCGGTTIKAQTTESAVGVTTARSVTAPEIAGYTFSSWAQGAGITIKSGSTSTSTISITSGASGNTLQANYTEVLTSRWHLVGESSDFPDGWNVNSTTMMQKKTGHSAEDVVYMTINVSSTAAKEFKIVDDNGASDDIWYGYSTDPAYQLNWTETDTKTVYTGSSNEQNLKFTPNIAGQYEFKVDYSGTYPTVTITFPTLYTLTYAIGTLKGTSGSISTSPTTASGSSVVSGSTVTLTAPAAKAGYTWKGWYTDAGGTSAQQCATRAYAVTMNANKTLYACYKYADYTVTLDKQTSATGYGGPGTVEEEHPVTYNTTLPALGGTMPTAAIGYCFMGFYTETGGGGVQVIDASGNWVNGVSGYTSGNKWVKTSDATLYAYYRRPKITDITLSNSVVAPGNTVTATPTFTTPVGGGAMSICWRLLYNNGNIYADQPDMTIVFNTVSFYMPVTSGSYKLAAILHSGTGDCGSGTVYDSVTVDLRVAGDHEVTVQYKCGDEVIQASEVVTGKPLEWTEITAPTIFGYTFSKWKAGDGITIEGADGNGEKASATIDFKAIYDGKLTAIYTQKSVIYFKNTLGWSNVYVNFYDGSYWNSTNGSGNKNVTNRNKAMTRLGSTDIWYYDYGAASITPSLYVSFTDQSQNNYENFSAADPGVNVVYPANYQDDINTDKASENGFKAATPMFVPLKDQAPTPLNSYGGNWANYYNRGYWTKYTPGTGYTLEIYNSAGDVLMKSVEFTSTDELMPMTAVVDLEATTTYKYQLRRGGTESNGVYYGNSGTMTYNNHGQNTAWDMTNSPFSQVGLNTNAAGEYTFHLSYSASSGNYRIRMAVDYPIKSGDYRIIYKDNIHTKWHPSAIIPRVNNGKDTVSFFIRPKNAGRVMKIQQSTVNPSTGDISWSAGTDITSSISSLQQDSVYNIYLTMNGSGEISVAGVEAYTGNYYIRTDCANSKWDNYRNNQDHLMTYSEYSITHGGYSHYYTHWVQTDDRKNVKFVIANDYSPCISDTLARETATGEWANVDDFMTEGGDLKRNANVRFMWYQHDNSIKRAYIDGAQGFANDFLVLLSADGKIKDKTGAITLTEVKFSDNQNWIYEANIKAQPDAQIKLRSTWGEEPTTIVQFFKGTSSSTETLITGSGAIWYDIRLLYDFKTNRLVAAMVPDGNYDDPTAINADVMFIRDHQGDISQITFTDDGKITDIETAYGVIQFNKWTLNNKERTGSHEPLDSPLSPYERELYFISFPFRVKLSEVFGFGTYGVHWGIQYYDGAERAAQGYWQGDPGFWKYYTDRTNVYLEPNQGYLIGLDLDLLTVESSVWGVEENERLELFFPSYGSLSTITNETVTKNLPSHACTINRAATEGLPDTPENPHTSYNRTIFDSHWNVMGVPTYVNTNALSFASTSWITDHGDHSSQGPNFLYTWNMDDNTLTPTSGASFKYHAMHAYMVQYYGDVSWKTAQGPAPIVARKTYAETPKDVEFCLEIQEGDKMLDRTFVRFSDDDEVSADFAFNEDMSKDMNGRKANIYTLTVDNVAVAGNTMPKNDHTISIPVNVKTRETNSFTFSIPEGTNGVGVTLVDKETGDRTILSASDYTVTLGEGMYSGRFELEISPIKNTPTGVEETETGEQKAATRKMLIDGQLYIIRDEKVFDARGIRVQ